MKNDTYLRALRREPVSYTPVWMMRQAGRYLPEYRQIREKAGDFLTLCKTPDLACEVTLQPLRRFELDAAILFSDILVIPEAMGLELTFLEGEGPAFPHPIRTMAAIEKLPIPDPCLSLSYVTDTIRLVKRHDDTVPLIGFSGSPWTLACYMVEGGASALFPVMKQMIYTAPETAHILLQKLSEAIICYLSAQIEAGVDAIQIFDTWGGILSTGAYQTFSLHYLTKIIARLKQQYPSIPTVIFTKYGGGWLEAIAETDCSAVGLDWTIDLDKARARIGHKVALQGNLDPMILLSNPETIVQEVRQLLAQYGRGSGHVFNLGHGIERYTPIEHVQCLVKSVHDFSPLYHQ